MRCAILAVVVLSACSASRPVTRCEDEQDEVDAANLAFRRATEWYTNATERDARSEEAEEAFNTLNEAATHQRKARAELADCLSEER